MTSLTSEEEGNGLDTSVAVLAAEMIVRKFREIELRLTEIEQRVRALEQEK
jgi:hypothetical protein